MIRHLARIRSHLDAAQRELCNAYAYLEELEARALVENPPPEDGIVRVSDVLEAVVRASERTKA